MRGLSLRGAYRSRTGVLGFADPCLTTRPRRRAAVIVSAASAGLGGRARQGGNDLVAERLQRLLLTVGHEVDVELVDADGLELLQLRLCLLGGAEDAEAVADLVGHEFPVLRPDPGMLVVVVELPRLDVVG